MENHKQRKPIKKLIKVVKDKYLFKQCKFCEVIKNISEYSHVSTIDNLVYTQGKCKPCRKIQALGYRERIREENELIPEESDEDELIPEDDDEEGIYD